MQVEMAACRRKLSLLWFVGSGVVFVILLSQAFIGYYGQDLQRAWGWMLPTVMPTLSLIIGVMTANAINPPKEKLLVDRFIYRFSLVLSAIYLLVVLATFLVQPISPIPPIALMEQSHLWLAPLQGLVSASIGVFFTKGKPQGKP